MRLTVKIVGKEVVGNDGSKFKVYSAVTAKQNWFNLAGEEQVPKLKKADGNIVTLVVERKFEKEVVTKAGHKITRKTLLITDVTDPTYEEAEEYSTISQAEFAKTLKDIE